jgi:hypothetical protein
VFIAVVKRRRPKKWECRGMKERLLMIISKEPRIREMKDKGEKRRNSVSPKV